MLKKTCFFFREHFSEWLLKSRKAVVYPAIPLLFTKFLVPVRKVKADLLLTRIERAAPLQVGCFALFIFLIFHHKHLINKPLPRPLTGCIRCSFPLLF